MKFDDIKNMIIKNHHNFKESKFIENTKGWSNYVIIVDDEYVFRFPREYEGYKNLEKEKFLLPYLRAKVKLDIPNFEYVSDEKSVYNYVAYKLIQGNELSNEILISLNKLEYTNIAEMMGSFLSSLHSIDSHSPNINLKTISNRNDEWINFKDAVLDKASYVLKKREKKWIADLFDKFERNLYTNASRLAIIHGDFTEEHIIINENNILSGIIDFGDICFADPAFDFAGIYSSYGKDFMIKVLSNYTCDVDSNFIDRIEQFYIKQIPLHELLCGVERKNIAQIESSIEKIRKIMNGENKKRCTGHL